MCFRVVHFIFVNMRSKSLYSYSFSSALFIYLFSYITFSPMPHETCESTSLFLNMKMRPMGFLAKMHPDNLYSFKHSVWDLTRECVCECECLHIYSCMLSVCYSGGWQVWGVDGDAKINLFKILIAFQKKEKKTQTKNESHAVWFQWFKSGNVEMSTTNAYNRLP